MKKTLRTIAIAALAMPLVASAQFKVETVWSNVVTDGKAHPIEGLDGGWDHPTASNPGTATVSRFAVGKDGKIYTTSHKDNAIVAYDGSSLSTYAKLSPVTVDHWELNGEGKITNTPAPLDARWNGTAITTDDAGNIIFNYCFIQAASVQKWGMVNPDGSVTDVALSTPLADIQNPTRLDIISHIVGDVTSEEGGIGYATTKGSPYVLMFHFKGDGSKVTSLTAKASVEVPEIKGGDALIVPSAKHQTVKEILDCANPENEFYAPYGVESSSAADCVSNGFIATVNDGVVSSLKGFGNRKYLASAVFSLNGKQYIVREYVNEAVMGDIFTTWKAVMTFGIFEIETGKCVATWMDSEYSNAYGMATLTAELVDDNTVNIYTWAATGSDDPTTGTVKGCYAAMVKVTKEVVELPDFEGDGTEANPYKIATAEDLCNAYRVVDGNGGEVWFEQTADIDMKGVKEYHAISGYDGNYKAVIHYDGKNHLITNFAPENVAWATVGETNFYYCTSVFGVPSGEISNLGVVNANCVTDHGAGILGAYAGHSEAKPLTLNNVFVTGKITGSGKYTGGMFGTTGNEVTMTNCFANVNVKGNGFPAGLIGRVGNYVKLTSVYTAGTVDGTDPFLVMGTNAEPEFDGLQVIAFNTGAADAISADFDILAENVEVATEENKATLIAEVKSWEGYSATSTILGLPALEWVPNEAGIANVTIDNENAPIEYYNLQGIRVNQPAAGSIVIMKQGTKTSKLIVR